MSRQRYPEEFKIEAFKQVTEKGKPVAEVAQRLGMADELQAPVALTSFFWGWMTMTAAP